MKISVLILLFSLFLNPACNKKKKRNSGDSPPPLPKSPVPEEIITPAPVDPNERRSENGPSPEENSDGPLIDWGDGTSPDRKQPYWDDHNGEACNDVGHKENSCDHHSGGACVVYDDPNPIYRDMQGEIVEQPAGPETTNGKFGSGAYPTGIYSEYGKYIKFPIFRKFVQRYQQSGYCKFWCGSGTPVPQAADGPGPDDFTNKGY